MIITLEGTLSSVSAVKSGDRNPCSAGSLGDGSLNGPKVCRPTLLTLLDEEKHRTTTERNKVTPDARTEETQNSFGCLYLQIAAIYLLPEVAHIH